MGKTTLSSAWSGSDQDMSGDPNDENEEGMLLQSMHQPSPDGSEAETSISPGVAVLRLSSTTTAEKERRFAESHRASEKSHQKPEFGYDPTDEHSQSEVTEVTDKIEKLVARMERHWKQSEKPHPAETQDTFPTDSLREILAGVSKCHCDELAALLVWSGWSCFQEDVKEIGMWRLRYRCEQLLRTPTTGTVKDDFKEISQRVKSIEFKQHFRISRMAQSDNEVRWENLLPSALLRYLEDNEAGAAEWKAEFKHPSEQEKDFKNPSDPVDDPEAEEEAEQRMQQDTYKPKSGFTKVETPFVDATEALRFKREIEEQMGEGLLHGCFGMSRDFEWSHPHTTIATTRRNQLTARNTLTQSI